MATELSEALISTIIKKMESRSSVELQAIYNEQNDKEWSSEAFEAIRRILAERVQTGFEPPPEHKSNDAQTPLATASVCAYPALRIVIAVYWVAAFFIGIVASTGIVIGIMKGELVLFISGVIGGLIGVITCIAAAEAIKVFLDIEENTRKSTTLLSQICTDDKRV